MQTEHVANTVPEPPAVYNQPNPLFITRISVLASGNF
jgi:hypothetical protein